MEASVPFSVDLWEKNAAAWIEFTAEGQDYYRDYVGTPAFLSLLPEIKGLDGLDLGCGHGYHARILAQRGANVTAVDLCQNFLNFALDQEKQNKQGIKYEQANVLELSFKDNSFDFAICYAALFDIADFEIAIKEAYRVVRKGGFFLTLVPHPCFSGPDFGWVRNNGGEKIAAMRGDYFSADKGIVREWAFEELDLEQLREEQKTFQSLQFRRTLSEYLNPYAEAGFLIEKLDEPKCLDLEAVRKFPSLRGANIVPIFLIVRARKVS